MNPKESPEQSWQRWLEIARQSAQHKKELEKKFPAPTKKKTTRKKK